MSRRAFTSGALLVVLAAVAGCRTAPPTHDGIHPANAPAATANSDPAPAAQPDAHDQVEALLASAQDAAARGDATEFQDCEAAVFQLLDRTPELAVRPNDCPAYRDDVVAELASLADQIDDGDDDTTADNSPPEPEPVAETHVSEVQEVARQAKYDLPVVVNPEVTSLIDFYTGRYREKLIAALERASIYLPYIRAELKKANMPLDLAWLPLVESAFNPHARSRAKAQGLWQFMAGTARLYDLRADSLVDERNDPFLATKAAVRHLGDLHNMFGSWELALAAYNCGAGNIQRALRRSNGDTDFWTLRRYLRRETRNYVPALWAVVVVTKNPAAYGLPPIEEHPPCLDRVPVRGSLDLDVLAQRAGLDAGNLADLNPALKQRLTPASGTYQLAVPCGLGLNIAETIAAIPPSERVRRFLHVIKKGDTPGAIARKYGSSVDAIMAANGIRNPRALRIGRTLIVPRGPVAAYERHTAASAPSRKAHAHAATKRYVVRRGDTLYRIARRFGTSTGELQKRNNLADEMIRPGDVLLLSR
ncbi:MAG TPA: LysM peptidoglycan-binding domain-containing protein [Thermoanaerobaculaceae bacterium]|nr:LysM peptidoglycan-binding domain-containing protein [Thermoanaerobaculaceae bacterium]